MRKVVTDVPLDAKGRKLLLTEVTGKTTFPRDSLVCVKGCLRTGIQRNKEGAQWQESSEAGKCDTLLCHIPRSIVSFSFLVFVTTVINLLFEQCFKKCPL